MNKNMKEKTSFDQLVRKKVFFFDTSQAADKALKVLTITHLVNKIGFEKFRPVWVLSKFFTINHRYFGTIHVKVSCFSVSKYYRWSYHQSNTSHDDETTTNLI